VVLKIFSRTKTHQATPNSPLLASAALVPMGNAAALRRFLKPAPWQQEAWQFYESTPEVAFGVEYQAASISKARLCIAIPDADGQGNPEPVDKPWATEFLQDFFDGQIGQQQMLARVTRLLKVPGEGYIVGAERDGKRVWKVASTEELESSSDGLRLSMSDGSGSLLLQEGKSWVQRVWNPDAKYEMQPVSPMRALLPNLREFHKLSARVNAEADSRLAGAGVFIVPESATVMNPGGGEGTPIHPDLFVSDLIEGMITPIQDPDSASAIVPTVIKARDDSIELFKHLTFSTPYDEKTQELREACIRRIATGLDTPIEIIMGTSGMNHWGAWQVEESAIKLHIEPVLALVCTALTDSYVRPGLKQLGIPNAEKYILWFDTSELTLRPNRGPEYLTMYQQGIVSAEATRRENGASEDDAPEPEEELKRLLVNLITGNPELAPQLIPQLASTLGVNGLPQIAPAEAPAQIENIPETDPGERSIPEQPSEEPSLTASATLGGDWRLSVAEMAALRALERAGRWLLAGAGRQYRGKLRNVEAWDMHLHLPKAQVCDEMFTDAYSTLQCAVPDDPCIGATVDGYVRGLITSGARHSRARLAEALQSSGCLS